MSTHVCIVYHQRQCHVNDTIQHCGILLVFLGLQILVSDILRFILFVYISCMVLNVSAQCVSFGSDVSNRTAYSREEAQGDLYSKYFYFTFM
jgi:hypothetical protein